MRPVTVEEIESLAIGAWILGTGGGGSPYLALLNMLPVPPLDGSKLLLAARLPTIVYVELARFGFMLLIVALAMTDLGLYLNRWSAAGAAAIVSMLH